MTANATKLKSKSLPICRLGTLSVPQILRFPQVLSHFKKAQHEVKLAISHEMSGHIIDKVINDELDAGFVMGAVDHPQLEVLQLTFVLLLA